MTDVFAEQKVSLVLLQANMNIVLMNPNHMYLTSSYKHDYSNFYVDFRLCFCLVTNDLKRIDKQIFVFI